MFFLGTGNRDTKYFFYGNNSLDNYNLYMLIKIYFYWDLIIKNYYTIMNNIE